MKTVHILPNEWNDHKCDPLCGAEIDYTANHGDTSVGWCQYSYMDDYNAQYRRVYAGPWEWCSECQDSPDFALYLLAVLG